jgi:hypothetical protein
VRVFDHADGDGLTIVEVTEHGRGSGDLYAVARVPSDWGLAFSWSHLDPVPVSDKIGREQRYFVVLEEDGRSCSCCGWVRWHTCRHCDVTLELVQAGKL